MRQIVAPGASQEGAEWVHFHLRNLVQCAELSATSQPVIARPKAQPWFWS